jgi:predicted nucleic acid-binding protein
MSVFVDTNVLLRSVQPSHPMHERVVRSVSELIAGGESLVFTPQIVAEFWNVATRPTEHNGLGFSHDQARHEVASLEEFFSLLIESADVYAEWKRLVVAYAVTGVQVHDARLVAAMNVHGVERILTFNGADFARYREIQTIIPA